MCFGIRFLRSFQPNTVKIHIQNIKCPKNKEQRSEMYIEEMIGENFTVKHMKAQFMF